MYDPMIRHAALRNFVVALSFRFFVRCRLFALKGVLFVNGGGVLNVDDTFPAEISRITNISVWRLSPSEGVTGCAVPAI